MLVTSAPKGLIIILIVIVDTTAAHALYVVSQLIVFLVVVWLFETYIEPIRNEDFHTYSIHIMTSLLSNK